MEYLVKFFPDDQLQGHSWVLTEVDGQMVACVAMCLVAVDRCGDLARALTMAWQAYREMCGCPHRQQPPVTRHVEGPRLVAAVDSPYPVTILEP